MLCSTKDSADDLPYAYACATEHRAHLLCFVKRISTDVLAVQTALVKSVISLKKGQMRNGSALTISTLGFTLVYRSLTIFL